MRSSQIEGLRPEPTLIERAYEAILGAIRDGRLSPGERLNQDELAARLSISRQPVGQALSILKSQGFVRGNGRRGLIVAPLEREFLRWIYQLREALDPLAARLAAERCTASDADQGQRLLADGRQADRGTSMEALIDADMNLHMWICQVSGNPLLGQTMKVYWNHLRRAMGEMLRQRSSRAVVWDEHQGIVTAIVERDAKAAARRARAHARGAAARVGESAEEAIADDEKAPRSRLPRARRRRAR